MDERLADRVVEEVLRRLNVSGPAALLIGERPGEDLGYRLTCRAPYDAVVIGSLSAGGLLYFSEPRVLDALLEGKPVFLWEPGLQYRTQAATSNRALWARLSAAERTLQQLGIRFYGGNQSHRLITAEQARQLQVQGRKPPAGAILTPLAREILGGTRS